MRDLIRNYKLILQKKTESESETESQPLMSSQSSTASFGTNNIFRKDSDTDVEADRDVKRIKKILENGNYEVYSTKDVEILTNNLSSKNFPNDYADDESSSLLSPKNETNSSLVTIFAIWNTTVGTSLLAMSWGIAKTGLFPAIFINILIAAICLYTADTLLKINQKHGILNQNGEVCDLCKLLIGRWAEIVAKIFSMVVLTGANIVYYILMSNFLYNSVNLLLENHSSAENPTAVLCSKNLTKENSNTQEMPSGIWDLYSSVPMVLAIIMFPMLNWKSPTFFTKFNSLGTISVLYIIIFVGIKSFNWGINMTDWSYELHLKPTFCALSGMLSMSYFIHNIIISIMRNNKQQEKNGRDLSIAFSLITFTYLFIGVFFYITFPLPKFCIEDNILNNFTKLDILASIARVLLLFQLFTVFPLISYMLRSDIFANINMIFKSHRFGEFSYPKVIVINLLIITVCILFACFLPRIGTLIRYTGALSGLVYIFMFPNLLKIASLKKEFKLTTFKLYFHISIIILGVFNLLLQFFINDS